MKNNRDSGAMHFADVLLIVFVVLKLCGVLKWSWWWVLSPLWISFLMLGIVVLLLKLMD